MIVFPAIDLKQGQVVRLAEGDMDRATVYGDDPAAWVLHLDSAEPGVPDAPRPLRGPTFAVSGRSVVLLGRPSVTP